MDKERTSALSECIFILLEPPITGIRHIKKIQSIIIHLLCDVN
jgi:hypothetical protein